MTHFLFRHTFKSTIDYVFVSKDFRKLGYLGGISQDWLKDNRVLAFPHAKIPSDHIPVVVEVELTAANSEQ